MDGIVPGKAEGLRDGAKRYLLKAPLTEGTEWMSVADLNTVERYRIIDVDRKVTVPAGVFAACVVVRMEVRMKEKRGMQGLKGLKESPARPCSWSR